MINWFPGHMQKARRQMEEQLKLVDIIIEIRDARIPDACHNPMLDEISNNKPRLIILNKADLADERQNRLWLDRFDNAILTNSNNDILTSQVVDKVKDILKDKLQKAASRGIRKKVLRAMVVGIPNVGKSTFINNIVKKKAARAENRPGVTKSLQWIRINKDVELLDTPGVLWPKIEDDNDGMLLALVGSINDDVVDRYELVLFALNYLKTFYPGAISSVYNVNENHENILESIAFKNGWLLKDKQIDINRSLDILLKDFRSGKIGRITWQKC